MPAGSGMRRALGGLGNKNATAAAGFDGAASG
jgi:hypothetical protein